MIISFVNQKGGVGKTTTAINLAISLKKKNFNLVFVDADPQGSAVQWHAIEGNKSFEILHHPSPIQVVLLMHLQRLVTFQKQFLLQLILLLSHCPQVPLTFGPAGGH
jgi:cellulose biosynthesis protein BcsQ